MPYPLPRDLRIPDDWAIIAGADTGTYMSGAIIGISPERDLFVLEEFPNYQYAGGIIELTGMTISEWVRWFGTALARYTGKPKNHAWADANTTFRSEIAHGLTLMPNPITLDVRTEITREYQLGGHIHFAPWLRVLPFEMEAAKFPDEPTVSGKFVRIKKADHTLDCLEHAASRRPRSKRLLPSAPKETLLEQLYREHRVKSLGPSGDPHLGGV